MKGSQPVGPQDGCLQREELEENKKGWNCGGKNNLRATSQILFGLHFTKSPLSNWPWWNPDGADWNFLPLPLPISGLLGAGTSLRSHVCAVPNCRCEGNINNKVKSHSSWGEVKRERKRGCYSASWLFLESKRECKGYCRICRSI